ncbi:uncharacterized protein LOC106011416 [Aplysia californica]|uniref:Uncharacterized protein LOC106011416 n=1 Tax=Aplysia californica TaxID=6500 RepID=A0ABM1VR91_APLCA|nr:uncharacterized protein LOC106011416 [Aplysia californica]
MPSSWCAMTVSSTKLNRVVLLLLWCSTIGNGQPTVTDTWWQQSKMEPCSRVTSHSHSRGRNASWELKTSETLKELVTLQGHMVNEVSSLRAEGQKSRLLLSQTVEVLLDLLTRLATRYPCQCDVTNKPD